jgi:hypothetical protein
MHPIRQNYGGTHVGPGTKLVHGVHSRDPRSACQISKFQNFHNFLNFHQPKGCFLSDRQKSPEFYAIKNVKKKKPIAVFKKKKSDSASQHRRPQKGQKNRF